nr:hypothetical protein [Psychrobacter sp. PraFG1]UNK06475.1 hypothetical protein MN210_08250 [Psychrobacter sp. PraFG1]
MKTGFAGELRCIVKKKDGTTVQDTGYQKNMFLNTGLDFLAVATVMIFLLTV